MGFHSALTYTGIHTVRKITAAAFTVTADMSGDVLIVDRTSGHAAHCTITLPSTTTTEAGFQITIINKTQMNVGTHPVSDADGVLTIAQESDGNDILYGGVWGASSADNRHADFFGKASNTKDIVLSGAAGGPGTWFKLTLFGVNKWSIIGTTVRTDAALPTTPFA